MSKRHVSLCICAAATAKDHIIHGQHYDVRVAAVRNTDTLRDAAARHGLMSEEASYWGPMAAGASLYASFLRGDERVKVEIAMQGADTFSNGSSDDGDGDGGGEINTVYIEGFAVGEVRGYAKFEQLRVEKALAGLANMRLQQQKEALAEQQQRALSPEETEAAAAAADLNEAEAEAEAATQQLSAGNRERARLSGAVPAAASVGGIMQVSKVLYGMHTPYVSKTPATGHPAEDWNTFFSQSEQIASFMHCAVDITTAGSGTPVSTSESVAGLREGTHESGAVLGGGVTVSTAAEAAEATGGHGLQPGQSAVSLAPIAESDVKFCGGVLVQVLAGSPDPVLAADILSARPRPANCNDTPTSTGTSADTSNTASGAEIGGQGHVEETDDAYVKRVQLERLRARVLSLDMAALVASHGVAGYVAAVLGRDPALLTVTPPTVTETLGFNAAGERDFEALERRCVDSSYTTQQAAKAPGVAEAYGARLGWAYRPVAFFCRCSQAKPEQKVREQSTYRIDIRLALIENIKFANYI